MRKKILAFVFAAALLMALAVPLFSGGGTAFATADLGLDGAANCLGKNVAASARDKGGHGGKGGQHAASSFHGDPSVSFTQRNINNLYCPNSPGGPR